MSATALMAADIERHLRYLPVLARTQTLRYRWSRALDTWIGGFKEVWLALYHGHRLFGDPELLRQADLLQRTLQEGVSDEFQNWPDRQTLEHYTLHPELHSHWQDLPVQVSDLGGGSYELSWTVPPDADGYWIKVSDRTVVSWLGFESGGTAAWSAVSGAP